ncbi:hypothetical protein PM082_010040 [Marasmius tenuissimus]|nr:hypothetical protein PM082_010040 [Marasmius tenuissimus]
MMCEKEENEDLDDLREIFGLESDSEAEKAAQQRQRTTPSGSDRQRPGLEAGWQRQNNLKQDLLNYKVLRGNQQRRKV